LLVAGLSDTATRERIFDDVGRRLPELLSALRHRAVIGAALPNGDAPRESPARTRPASTARPDPFIPAPGTGQPGRSDPRPFDPFDEGP
jgi:hypothetical protein